MEHLSEAEFEAPQTCVSFLKFLPFCTFKLFMDKSQTFDKNIFEILETQLSPLNSLLEELRCGKTYNVSASHSRRMFYYCGFAECSLKMEVLKFYGGLWICVPMCVGL